jgi:pSer/pThr/pTyr-binding forkhead associated (FHA) protein
MVICPNCLYKNMTGAVFCSECGAQLVREESQKTGNVRVTNGFVISPKTGPVTRSAAAPPASYPEAYISLHILSSGVFVPLPEDEEEVILGRASEGQSMVPDINLEPYQAFEAGVSRIHAAIRVVGGQALITDLGSGNGTRVNGNKIEPHTPHPIANGDLLNLGKLKLQVIIKDNAKK